MGVLANHVPSIEQLKPGLVEIIEESGGSKQFFRTSFLLGWPASFSSAFALGASEMAMAKKDMWEYVLTGPQFRVALPSSSLTPS